MKGSVYAISAYEGNISKAKSIDLARQKRNIVVKLICSISDFGFIILLGSKNSPLHKVELFDILYWIFPEGNLLILKDIVKKQT